MRTRLYSGLLVACLAIAALPAQASMTCFCKISGQDLTGQCHPDNSSIIEDLTGKVGTTYSWPRTNSKAQDCDTKCSDAASTEDKQTIANAACAQGVANGTVIRAYAALGNCGNKGEYHADGTIGTLINTPAVTRTTCTCPQGWAANQTNVDGGVTADGRCKKMACQPDTVVPAPPNGTTVGTAPPPFGVSPTSWGFSWGNAFYAFGNAENGGAAKCVTVVIQPAQCRLQ